MLVLTFRREHCLMDADHIGCEYRVKCGVHKAVAHRLKNEFRSEPLLAARILTRKLDRQILLLSLPQDRQDQLVPGLLLPQ